MSPRTQTDLVAYSAAGDLYNAITNVRTAAGEPTSRGWCWCQWRRWWRGRRRQVLDYEDDFVGPSDVDAGMWVRTLDRMRVVITGRVSAATQYARDLGEARVRE